MVDSNPNSSIKIEDKSLKQSFQSLLTSLFSLADNDIIDLSTIRKFKHLLSNNINRNTILSSINHCLAIKLNQGLNDIKTNHTDNLPLIRLSSSITAFMVLLLNVKEYYMFTLNILSPDSETRNALVSIITGYYGKGLVINRLLSHLFLSEYKTLFFLSPSVNYLETLFIDIAVNFAHINDSIGIETTQEETIGVIYDSITLFKLDYDEYFKEKDSSHSNSNSKESSSPLVIGLNEKSKLKYMLCQSIIRLILYKSKKFNSTGMSIGQYIISLIDKDMKENKDRYGDKYNILFRKEIIYDDIIKHLFFFFGSELMTKAFTSIVLKHIKETDTIVDTEVFEALFKEMCLNTLMYMPNALKFLLHAVLIKSQQYFSFEDGKVYSPLFTLVLFNFYLSPKVQELHGLIPCKYPVLIKINRLLRNICYNKQFDFKDELTPFNSVIEDYHNYLIGCFKKLLEIDFYPSDDIGSKDMIMESIDMQLLIEMNDIIIPKFLFDLDCSILSRFIKGEPIIKDKELLIK